MPLSSIPVGLLVLGFMLAAVIGYLMGSVSFAILVSKALYREDVREKGSGNAGMTNVLRTHGKLPAILTLIGDMGKGILAVWCGRWVFMLLLTGVDTYYGAYAAGIAALIGHALPLFFRFKGGKGVAVSGGVFLALCFPVAFSLIVLFAIIALISKMVSLGSVIVFILYPICTFFYTTCISHENPLYSTICSAIIGAIVVVMHKNNIRRIVNGTEYKFGSGQQKPEDQR